MPRDTVELHYYIGWVLSISSTLLVLFTLPQLTLLGAFLVAVHAISWAWFGYANHANLMATHIADVVRQLDADE